MDIIISDIFKKIIILEAKMEERSHIDKEKLSNIRIGNNFEYKDVVDENIPDSEHSEDGALFKSEVESGLYDGVVVSDPDATHVVYKKVSDLDM
jgi:hypothetical protein